MMNSIRTPYQSFARRHSPPKLQDVTFDPIEMRQVKTAIMSFLEKQKGYVPFPIILNNIQGDYEVLFHAINELFQENKVSKRFSHKNPYVLPSWDHPPYKLYSQIISKSTGLRTKINKPCLMFAKKMKTIGILYIGISKEEAKEFTEKIHKGLPEDVTIIHSTEEIEGVTRDFIEAFFTILSRETREKGTG